MAGDKFSCIVIYTLALFKSLRLVCFFFGKTCHTHGADRHYGDVRRMQREQQDLCESIACPLEHLKHVLCRASDLKNFELIFCLISTVADNISPDRGKRARVHATIHEAPDVKQMSKASTVSDSLSLILMFIKRFENLRESSHINSHSLAAR